MHIKGAQCLAGDCLSCDRRRRPASENDKTIIHIYALQYPGQLSLASLRNRRGLISSGDGYGYRLWSSLGRKRRVLCSNGPVIRSTGSLTQSVKAAGCNGAGHDLN